MAPTFPRSSGFLAPHTALAVAAATAVALLAPRTVSAQVPGVLPFQARLVDAAGAPVSAGTPVTAALFTTPTGGSPVWGPETHTVTPVNGIVTLFLGAGDTPVPFDPTDFTGGDRFLEIVVGAETLAPRFRVAGTGYALRAASVTPGAIDATALANGAVTSAKIAANAVGGSEIAADAVGSEEIKDGTITAADLAPNSVGGSEIADDSVSSGEIKDDSITAADLATNSVGSAEIAANAVGASEIATGAVGSSEIAANAVNDGHIVDEPGVASASTSTNVALTRGTPVNILTRTLAAPTSGFVIATATVNAELGHAPPIDDSEVLMSISTTSAIHDAGNLVRFLLPFTATAGVYRAALCATDVFSVGAGNTTFHVVAESQDGLTNSILDANLNLVFVPTAYGSVSATEPGRESARIEE